MMFGFMHNLRLMFNMITIINLVSQMKIPEMNYKIMFSKLEKLNLFIIYDQNNGSLFRTITKTLQMKMKNNL
mgnify:CR=1 FL=1